MSAVQGQRLLGGFILITGQDGIRYALRPNQVAVAHDADKCHDETILRIYGGHTIRVPSSLDEVLAWSGRASSAKSTRRAYRTVLTSQDHRQSRT